MNAITQYLNRAFGMGVSLRIDSTKETKLGDGKKYLHVQASAEMIKETHPTVTKRNLYTQRIYPLTRENLEEFNETTDRALVDVFCRFVGEASPFDDGSAEVAASAGKPAPRTAPAKPAPLAPSETAAEETEAPFTPAPPPSAPAGAAAGIPKLTPEAPKRGRGRPPKAEAEATPAERPATPPGPKTRKPPTAPAAEVAEPVVVKYTIGDKNLAPVFGKLAVDILGFDPRTDKDWKEFVLSIRPSLVGLDMTVDGQVTDSFKEAMTKLLKPNG